MTSPRTGIAKAIEAPLSRADYVFVHVLLWVVVAGAAIAAIGNLWPTRTIDFLVGTGDPGPARTVAGQASNATARYNAEVLWTITDPSLGQRLLVALPGLWGAALVIVIALLLRSVVTRIRNGGAFTTATTNRVRAIALVLIFGGILYAAILAVTQFALVAGLQDEVSVAFTIDPIAALAPFVAGFVLLVLVEVFRRGIQLSEDVEGLV